MSADVSADVAVTLWKRDTDGGGLCAVPDIAATWEAVRHVGRECNVP